MFDRETAVTRVSYGASVKRVGFRGRLFVILLAFALIPSVLISLAWSATGSFMLSFAGATAAWDSVAATGERAIEAARTAPLTPEQRNVMRQRETVRRQVMTRDADTAVRDSGLQLNPQERARFESRYIQERRKVEQSLRQQIETERQKEIPALIQQLRKEFQLDEPGKSPVTKPATSPKSGK